MRILDRSLRVLEESEQHWLEFETADALVESIQVLETQADEQGTEEEGTEEENTDEEDANEDGSDYNNIKGLILESTCFLLDTTNSALQPPYLPRYQSPHPPSPKPSPGSTTVPSATAPFNSLPLYPKASTIVGAICVVFILPV